MSSALANTAPARGKSPDAFRTISEVSAELDVPQHVLRFWETRFGQLRPVKRAGGRRFYRPEDVALLRGIRSLLYSDGYTIKGVQKVLRERGQRYVAQLGRNVAGTENAGGAWRGAETVLDVIEVDAEIDAEIDAGIDAEIAPEASPSRRDFAIAALLRVHADAAEKVAMEEHKRVKLELLLAELLILRDRLRQARGLAAA